MTHEPGGSWYVFHHLATHFAYGTRETAERYLRFLNRNRAPDCFVIWEIDHHPFAHELPHDDWMPHIVDMEADMAEWEG